MEISSTNILDVLQDGGIEEQSIMGQLLYGDVELDGGGKINEEDMRGIVTDLIAAGA